MVSQLSVAGAADPDLHRPGRPGRVRSRQHAGPGAVVGRRTSTRRCSAPPGTPSRRCRARTAGLAPSKIGSRFCGIAGHARRARAGRGAARTPAADAGSSISRIISGNAEHHHRGDRGGRARRRRAVAGSSAAADRVLTCSSSGSCRRWCAGARGPAWMGSRGSSGSNMPSGGGSCGSSSRGWSEWLAVAAFERAVRVKQDRHVVVGVVAKPDRQAGRGVLAQVLPRPPQRLQAGDGLGVAPPLRAPHTVVAEDRSGGTPGTATPATHSARVR